MPKPNSTAGVRSPLRRRGAAFLPAVTSCWRVGRAALLVSTAVLLLAQEPARAEPLPSPSTLDTYAGFIAEAVRRFDIPETWIRAVMRVESAGEPHAVSSAGAIGLMQIMPATWSALRLQYGPGADPFDPRDNILAGAAYLRDLHDRYGEPGFLAAYNAGPQRYDEYLKTGRPLPTETVAYLASVEPLLGGDIPGGVAAAVPATRSWTEAPLFAAHAPASGGTLSALFPPSSRLDHGQATQDLTALVPPGQGVFMPRPRKSDALP